MKELALGWRHYHIMEALSLEEDPRYNEGTHAKVEVANHIWRSASKMKGPTSNLEACAILKGRYYKYRGRYIIMGPRFT